MGTTSCRMPDRPIRSMGADTGDAWRHDAGERRVDFGIREGKVARDLVAQQHADLFEQHVAALHAQVG